MFAETGSYVTGLKCRECGATYKVSPRVVCDCLAPLEVAYDVEALKKTVTREKITSRPPNMWRYRELLPLDGEPTCSRAVGFTPLVEAPRLAKALGCERIYRHIPGEGGCAGKTVIPIAAILFRISDFP